MVSHVFLQFNLTLVNKNSIIYYGFQKGTSCVNYEKRGCQESDSVTGQNVTLPTELFFSGGKSKQKRL